MVSMVFYLNLATFMRQSECFGLKNEDYESDRTNFHSSQKRQNFKF